MGFSAQKQVEVSRGSDGRILAPNCAIADSSWQRMKGLLGKKQMAPSEAIWIKPCNSVHTLFMSFPIDVVFLDGDFRVVAFNERLAPWRFTRIVLKARSVIEFSAGTVASMQLARGDLLRFREVG